MKKPIVVLDRDGVINKDSPEYIKSPNEFFPITGSLEAIAKLNQQGFTVVVATNQSGIGRGLFSEKTLHTIHEKLITQLQAVHGHLDGIFYCPHDPSQQCNCRKPKPGLFHQICKRFDCQGSDLLCIGDSLRDIQAAKAAGVNELVLVKTGNGKQVIADHSDDPALDNVSIVPNLATFVDEFY